ncbi:hypothetical protein K9M06_00940 [Candidatus Bipolaricaulota bacterium]|nr:hypothetical protein [Candidatus Bipolaricaulota bacterium]
MISPKDNPELLKEWRRLEEELLKAGVGITKTREEIAEFYDTTYHTARYWLDESRRNRDRNRNRTGRYQREPHRREYDKAYKHYIRHLPKYATGALEEGEVLGLGEISDRLGEAAEEDPEVDRKITMEPETVEKKITEFEEDIFQQEEEGKYRYTGREGRNS